MKVSDTAEYSKLREQLGLDSIVEGIIIDNDGMTIIGNDGNVL